MLEILCSPEQLMVPSPAIDAVLSSTFDVLPSPAVAADAFLLAGLQEHLMGADAFFFSSVFQAVQ